MIELNYKIVMASFHVSQYDAQNADMLHYRKQKQVEELIYIPTISVNKDSKPFFEKFLIWQSIMCTGIGFLHNLGSEEYQFSFSG